MGSVVCNTSVSQNLLENWKVSTEEYSILKVPLPLPQLLPLLLPLLPLPLPLLLPLLLLLLLLLLLILLIIIKIIIVGYHFDRTILLSVNSFGA